MTIDGPGPGSDFTPLPEEKNTPAGTTASAPTRLETELDALLENVFQDDDYLKTAVNRVINLPPGEVNLFELQALISQVIQQLKEGLTEDELKNTEKQKEFRMAALHEANSLLDFHRDLLLMTKGWADLKAASTGKSYSKAKEDLLQAYADFNTFMQQTGQQDRAALQSLNETYAAYNDPAALQALVDQKLAENPGMTQEEAEQAVLDDLNSQIQEFNDYVATRPDLQEAIAYLHAEEDLFNQTVQDLNQQFDQINEDRQEKGLPPLPKYNAVAPRSNPQPLHETLSEEPLLAGPLPLTAADRLANYTSPPTAARTELLRSAMKAQATGPVQQNAVDTAISQAQANGPYATEQAFFIAVRDAYAAQFSDPNFGITQFNQALNDIPIREGPAVPGINDFGTVQAPALTDPGTFPESSFQALQQIWWVPTTIATLFFVMHFNNILDLADAFRESQSVAFSGIGRSIISPTGFLNQVSRVFIEDIGSFGGGGLSYAAFAMGLHSRNLEIALSRGILNAIAQNASYPISGRVFARLQFTAMELLSKSALLATTPAARLIASVLGTAGATDRVLALAGALAFGNEIISLVNANLLRAFINGTISALSCSIRFHHSMALNQVVQAEMQLSAALQSGDRAYIQLSLTHLVHASAQLNTVTRLQSTLGVASIGGLARFTRMAAATLNLSLLSVALYQFGRALGMPGLVPQLYANLAGLPMIDILTAMAAGSRIIDYLDNPVAVLYLKQTLVDELVYRRGFSSVSAGLLINSAVNNVILRGGIHSFSHLRAELQQEYLNAGLNFFQAHLLANETMALIRGDMGVQYLSVAFGLNFDRTAIASSISDNIYGVDRGLAGAMLSNAVVRSLLYGGFGSRVRLQNELLEKYQTLGLSRQDAYEVAAMTTNFIATMGVLVPLTNYPGLAELFLGNTVLNRIAFGGEFVREELIDDLEQRGLSNGAATYVADQLISVASGRFTAPDNLQELVLDFALERALSSGSFQTQREFRDSVFNELRVVGFSTRDALFLANSAAAYGINGAALPVLGISPAEMALTDGAVIGRLSSELGISSGAAERLYGEAKANALGQAPFSSGDEFRNVLREQVFLSVLKASGRADGHLAFDRALGDLNGSSALLGLAGLTEQLGAQVMGILRPDIGSRLATEIKDQILNAVLGGSHTDEVEEHRNPLSILNQLEEQIGALEKEDEKENIRKMIKMLQQLLAAFMSPNAALNLFGDSTISDPINTSVGILGLTKPIGEILDIQA